MRHTTQAKLSQLLNRPEIPPHIRKEIFDAMCAPTQRKLQPAGSDWTKLRSTVSHHRLMFKSNAPKWSKDYTDIYHEYIAILDRVLLNIDNARLKLQPDGTPYTVVNYTASRKSANHARTFEGKVPLPTCGERWQDWIPESVRTDYVTRLNAQYANDPKRAKGKRFVPFVTAKERKWVKENITRLEGALKAWRRRVITDGTEVGPNSTSDTPFGALMLAACRMAERELFRRMKADPHPELPINWRHLLTPEMRDRLRRGETDHRSIDLQGLSQFYYVHGNFDAEGAAARDEQARDAAYDEASTSDEEASTHESTDI